MDQPTAPPETNFAAFDFLQKQLIPNIKEMIEKGFDYLAFPIIAQCIELLGAFLDSDDLSHSASQTRFERGLDQFPGNYYKQNKTLFYEQLRCSFAHQMRPGEGFVLTSLQSNAKKEIHLKMSQDGDCILVVDCLLEDLERAVKRTYHEFQKPSCSFKTEKLNTPFLKVTDPTGILAADQQVAPNERTSSRYATTGQPVLSSGSFEGVFSTVSPPPPPPRD